MRKAKRKSTNLLYRRIAEMQMSEPDREHARYAVRESEAIVDAILWIKEKLGSVGTFLLRPSFKH